MRTIILVSVFAFLLVLQISEAQEVVLCSDSDDADIYNKGRTVGQEAYVFQDTCLSDKLVAEAVCINNKQTYLLFDCPNGCSNGACNFVEQNQTCSQQGPTVFTNGKTYTNKCLKSDSDVQFEDAILKYSCLTENSMSATNPNVVSEIKNCGDKVCSSDDGEPKCADPTESHLSSIGIDPSEAFKDKIDCSTQGKTTLFNKVLYTDSCENFDPETGHPTTSIQYGCSEDSKFLRKEFDCKKSGQKCLDGECVPLAKESNEKTNFSLGGSIPTSFIVFLGLVGIVILCVVIFVTHNMHKKLKEDLKKSKRKRKN